MAGSNFFNRLGKISSLLIVLFPLLALSGCFGEGDGPTVIPATPVTPEEPPTDGGEAFDSGLLINGDFEAGVSPWTGNAANVVDDGGNAVNSADIAVAGDAFNVNLTQVLTITEGETYTLSFKARSNRTRTMLAGIGLNEEPFTNVTETVNLTTDWQTFTFVLTATGFGNANSRVLFDMGADTGLVLIDDVSLFAASGGGGAAGTPIDPDVTLYATGSDPDLVIPDDYAERTPFGSGSIIDAFYAEDETYSPALSVFSGTNYGANVAQVGFIGFPAGFLGTYETVDFKVKGMPNFVIFVKLFDGVDTLRINLTSSDFSELLTDGWYQLSIPVSRFSGADQATGIVLESDNTSATQFRMLLTDVGFSGTGTGTGGGGTATGGEVPDDTIFAADGSPADLTPNFDPFGSGSSFATVADNSYDNALEVTVGVGYGGGALAQLGLTGLAAGFATGYDEFLFKVKGLTADNTILAKLEAGGGGTVTIDLTTPPANVAVTDLGDGWSQVVIQMAAFGDVSTSSQIVFQTLDGAYAEGATFLLTDIGFNNAAGGGGGGTAMGGEVPDATIFAADGSAADLTPNFDPFGSGSSFATVADSSYANALEITVGAGYGGGALAQLGLTGLGAGFATGYDEFLFKVKGLTADNTILVKFEAGGGGTVTIDLTAPPANVAVTDLGDGWSQVVIQMVAFGDVSTSSQIVFQTLDGAYAEGATFLLTDFGFNNAGGGTAMGGEVPEVIIYAADGSTPDLTPNYDPFGSGSTFATIADTSYANAFEITVGAGYGGGALAQLGLTGLGAGFATGYDEFLFKVKGLTADNTILVKFEAGGGGTVTIDLTAPPANVAVTDLGDGWSQVVIQMVAFGDVSTSSQIVFQTLDGAYAEGATFLLTDFGFNNAGGGTAMGGEVPEVIIYAADGSTPDLTPNYDPFGSGSTFATIADTSYANAFEITVGAGYGGGALAQLGLTGLGAGFATGYDEFLFKVKGLTADNTILVKLEAGGGGTVTIDLTAPPANVAVTDLGDGWSQVVIQMVAFGDVSTSSQIVFQTLDGAYAEGATFLLTDFGFNNAGGGGGTAMGGEVPEVIIYAADGSTPDLTPNYDPFGSGSTFATIADTSYANAFEITVGAGYGGGALAQLGLTGLGAGFATGYDEFLFKVKGLTADNTILVKFEAGGGGTVTIDLTAPPANVAVTDLGDGWSQVVIQMVAFGDVSTSSQIVFQTLDGAYAEGATFLLTDFGFNNAGGGGGTAMGGEVPEVIIYAADGSTPDLTPNYDPFGSGSTFATIADTSYANAFEITVGAGYGGGALAQLGLTGLGAGFATGYDEFLFKVKGLTADNTILVKFEAGGGGTVTIDLTAPPANVAVTDLGDGWSQVVIQMVAFGDVSTSSQIVFQTLDGAYAEGATFLLTDFGFNNAGGGVGGGNIAVNGGFETGMFNDGTPDANWQQFPGGGTQTITNVNPSAGTFAANLVIPVRGPADPGVDNLIKNANLEAGNLTPNASITVSFDMRGTLSGAGGVVFAELFSELSGGGTSKAEILGGGPLAPNAGWTNYSYTTTLGGDVSGGVTLQLKVGCGAVEGCGADIFFDNVSITIN